MAHYDDADDTSISVARYPTRRRLLSMLTGLPAATVIPGSPPARSIEDTGVCAPDAISDLFSTFEALVARHEATLWRCDRLEAFLLAELDHPRVRLPLPASYPVRYAADVDTIIRFVPPGRRWRIQAVLSRRQRAWARGARVCGLTKAQEHKAVLDAAATLLATPANTLADVRTKILVLLASQEAGGAFRDATPWGELRSILADLTHLSAPVCG